MHSPDLTSRNIDQLAELFPTVVTESVDDEGNQVQAVDFDLLRQELSDHVLEGPQERYRLDWPGKRQALFGANASIAKTLRPVREESVNFGTTQNLFIEGDNLDVLKLLQESYLGKVKLIYIDPPYNTGNDFVYADTFGRSREEELERSGQVDAQGVALVSNSTASGRFHSNWLSMMYPRLKLARNLLTDDGVLVVSIDEHEHSNLVAIGSEVLGRDSYRGEIVVKTSSRSDQRYISMQHEYLVFFVRSTTANSGSWREKKGGLSQIYAAFDQFRQEFGTDWEAIHKAAQKWYRQFPPADPVYASKHYNRMDERGIFFADNISGPNDGQYEYEVIHPVTKEPCKEPARGWVFPESSMRAKIADDRVYFGADHTTVPNLKTYLHETESQNLTSIRYVDGRAASKRLQSLFGEKVFTNPKDELMLCDIYQALGVASDDIVLDMFSGSGSALHAVLLLNRAASSSARYIGVQIAEDLKETVKTAKGAAKQVTSNAVRLLTELGRPATVAEIGKERMRRVGTELPHELLIDVGFRVLKVDTTSLSDVLRTPDALHQDELDLYTGSVKSDRTSEDLLFQVLLDWGLELTMPIAVEQVGGHEVLVVEDGALIACFESSVSVETMREIAKRQPLRAVFLDGGFATDADRINAEQVFAEVSPSTDVKAV